MGFSAMFRWTTLRGKHCRHPIGVMGVVDTFQQWLCKASLHITLRITTRVVAYFNPKWNTFQKHFNCFSPLIYFCSQKVEKPTLKLFQNLSYRPTVYRTWLVRYIIEQYSKGALTLTFLCHTVFFYDFNIGK